MAPEQLRKPGQDEKVAGDDFFADLDQPMHLERETFDLYTPNPSEPKPAVVFVHGGPVPKDQHPKPRTWPVFTGYGALAASAGLVGVTFNHRLYTMEHYPDSAIDLSAVVDQAREQPQIDSDRIVLWFFSGGGGLAADWLRTPPTWLRGIAWTYPVLVPPPDWPGDGPRFDCSRAITDAPELPKLLVRVSDEYPSFKDTQDAVVEAARTSASKLDIIDVPRASHGYEAHGYQETSRHLTTEAMSWMAETLDRQ